MLTKQERIANSWKRELEKSAQAYESLINKLKSENGTLRGENEHWR